MAPDHSASRRSGICHRKAQYPQYRHVSSQQGGHHPGLESQGQRTSCSIPGRYKSRRSSQCVRNRLAVLSARCFARARPDPQAIVNRSGVGHLGPGNVETQEIKTLPYLWPECLNGTRFTRGLVWCLLIDLTFAARDFGLWLGANEEHIPNEYVTRERQRQRPKEPRIMLKQLRDTTLVRP